MAETAVPTGETIWDNGQTFTESTTTPRADTLRIKKGATIFFKHGITYEIVCNKLLVEGDCYFVCTGDDSADAVQPPHRMPDARASGAPHWKVHQTVFYDWPSDPEMVGLNAPTPAPGGNGANVVIRFRRFEGELIDPVKQSHREGGRGGRGARGGEGKTLWCTCGAEGQANSGRASSDAPPGRDGSVSLVPLHDYVVIEGGTPN